MVMGEIMALNAQYGEYVKRLNVSEEPEEVIINTLHNMIADQNQARGEPMLEMQTPDPLVPARADWFYQMRAISDPNSQLEVLAYDLTASELDAFAEFQEQRQNTSAIWPNRCNSQCLFWGHGFLRRQFHSKWALAIRRGSNITH
jgi:hypothetical protein